jgi:hypothetical protein
VKDFRLCDGLDEVLHAGLPIVGDRARFDGGDDGERAVTIAAILRRVLVAIWRIDPAPGVPGALGRTARDA